MSSEVFTERDIELLEATAGFFGGEVYELDSSETVVISGDPSELERLVEASEYLAEGETEFKQGTRVKALGELSESSQWHHGDINTDELWNRSASTSGTIVAVIDTGVNNTTELSGRLVSGWDFVDNDSDASEELIAGDAYGHGTFVAHEIAGVKGNNEGGWGVCESCKIMPLRVLGQDGYGSMWDVALAIDWAVANGADVINLSLGAPAETRCLRQQSSMRSLTELL